AGVPFTPSTSTRHSRHEPNASSVSVAHSLGTSTPASAAARITDVPSGPCTDRPSTSTSTVDSPLRAGVPRSGSLSKLMISAPVGSDGWHGQVHRTSLEVLAEVLDRAAHRHRGQPAHRAQRAVGHQLAEVLEQLEVRLSVLARDDLVEGLLATHRTHPARRALAARLDRA